MRHATDLQKIVNKIKELYYDLDMSEEDCIVSFLDDLKDNYDYDTLDCYIDNVIKKEES